MWIVVLVCGLLALLSGVADACQICYAIPKVSVADHLISAERVVLAREDPERPFHLKAVEVLKGEVTGPEIDLFLDSSTRRLLTLYPERKVVCAYRHEGPEVGWKRIGVSNAEFDALVREVLRRVDGWKEDPAERARYFSGFLGREDDQIRSLAHLEVARAPYDQIRGFGGVLSRDKIHAFLGNFRYMEWHALYILLLAQSAHEADHEWIAEKVRSAAEFGLNNQLAAWATAWIEVGEGEALEFLEEHYFENPDRNAKEMKALIAALSVHGNRGHLHLRDRIVDAYRKILDSHPDLAPLLVADLTVWEQWDLAETVEQVLATVGPREFNLEDRGVVIAYLLKAATQRSVDASDRSSPPRRSYLPGLVLLLAIPALLALASARRR